MEGQELDEVHFLKMNLKAKRALKSEDICKQTKGRVPLANVKRRLFEEPAGSNPENTTTLCYIPNSEGVVEAGYDRTCEAQLGKIVELQLFIDVKLKEIKNSMNK